MVPIGLFLLLLLFLYPPTQSSAIKCNANAWIVSGKQTLVLKTTEQQMKLLKKTKQTTSTTTKRTLKKKGKKKASGIAPTYFLNQK